MRGGDDEPVVVETGDGHLMDLDGPAAEGRDRSLPGGQLPGERAAFPGDEDPAGGEQRKGELDELGERCDGPGGDGRPAATMAAVSTVPASPTALAATERKRAFLATGSTSSARVAGSATASGIPG
jgi:hypothetical protein